MTSFYVGQVERIVLGTRVIVCACCGLSVENCGCQHDQREDHLDCVYRDGRRA